MTDIEYKVEPPFEGKPNLRGLFADDGALVGEINGEILDDDDVVWLALVDESDSSYVVWLGRSLDAALQIEREVANSRLDAAEAKDWVERFREMLFATREEIRGRAA